VTFYTLFVSAKCDTLEKRAEKLYLIRHLLQQIEVSLETCHAILQRICAILLTRRGSLPNNYRVIKEKRDRGGREILARMSRTKC
jgi:hypothetical protein